MNKETVIKGMLTEEEFLQHVNGSDENSLKHVGVKGMKWGQRKAESSVSTSSGSRGKNAVGPDGKPKAPSVGRALAFGAFGLGKKDRYTSPEALKQRSAAAKTLTIGVLSIVGSTAMSYAAKSSNENFALGAAITGRVLNTVGTAAILAGSIQGAVAAGTEKQARENG